MHTSEELERQALSLVRQYGLFMPKPVREFLAKMADFLNWNQLKKEL